jgi:hypothetical protein
MWLFMSMKCVLIKIKFDIYINIWKYIFNLKKKRKLIITDSAQQCRAQVKIREFLGFVGKP